MNIALICLDTRGGVQPYIALGTGLQRHGHYVRIVAQENYRAMVHGYGLDFHAIPGNIENILDRKENRGATEKGFLSAHLLIIRVFKQTITDWMREAVTGCQGCDLIIGGVGGMYIGYSIAEKMRIPFLQAHLQPVTATTAFPGIIMPWLWRMNCGCINRLSHYAVQQLFWQPFRMAVNHARRTVLNLPPASVWGRIGHVDKEKLMLYGFSRHILPKPQDWPQQVHITGYWFMDTADSWIPSPELENFLRNGPPPVLVGFGSMTSDNREEFTDTIVSALKQAGVRGILVSGWGGLCQNNLSSDIFAVESLPYDRIFPRMAAVIHHGGAGTTAQALRCGIPSIIVPFTAEQPFWGETVWRLGAGPKPIPRSRLTSERLATAITGTIDNAAMKSVNHAIAEKISRENGVECAIEHISSAYDAK